MSDNDGEAFRWTNNYQIISKLCVHHEEEVGPEAEYRDV